MTKTGTESGVSIVNEHNFGFIANKKTLFIAVSVVLIIGSGLGANYILNRPKCSDRLLSTASQELDSKNIDGLSKTAQKITAIKGHESDPSCMYVLTRYYIERGDGIKAAVAIKSLKHDLEGKAAVSPIVGGPLHPDVKSLGLSVDFLNRPYQRSSHLLFDVTDEK